MEKEEMIKKFQKNGYDEKTINMLVEAIEDFKEIELDKYVPISEVVERICRNLKNGIEYKKINDSTLGSYSNENLKITLNEDAIENTEELKSVFFHELIHCITTFKELDMVGFHTSYKDYKNPEDNTVFGYGLNEGVTSYIERKRAEKKGFDIGDSYPILNSLVENLLLVVGEKDLLNLYFNDPSELEEFLCSKSMELMPILDGFDEVFFKEEEIVKIKRGELSKEAIMMAIFGEGNLKDNEIYKKIGQPVSWLNTELFNAIDCARTVDDFDKLAQFVKRLESQKLGMDKNTVYGRLLKEQRSLEKRGVQKEETDAIISKYDLVEYVELQQYFESFDIKDKDELIIKLYESYNEKSAIERLRRISNEPSYSNYFNNQLFNRRIPLKLEQIIPIGKILKEYPEIVLDEISLKQYEEYPYEVFVIETMEDKKFAYLDTPSTLGEISEDNILKVQDTDINYDVEIKDDEAIILEDGEKIICELIGKLKSNFDFELEGLMKKLNDYENQMEKFKEFKAPQEIIENQVAKIEKVKEQIEEKKQEFKNRKKNRVIESKEIATFEEKLMDIEAVDKKTERINTNIQMMQDEKITK